MERHITGAWIGKVKGLKNDNGGESTNYYAWLIVDGQKKRKTTGTSDPDEADKFLENWKTQESHGIKQTSGLRYEDLRDDYLAAGNNLGYESKSGEPSAIQRDLDTFFKSMRVSAIGGNLTKFRTWRESQKEVLEFKAEILQREIALRTLKAAKPDKKRIEAEATTWVENGVKATTDKRLKYLRAMFFHAFKKTQKISKGDIPYFPILGTNVDNVKQNKFSKKDLENIIAELPAYQQLIRFLHATGMRSGQAAAMTWDMIDHDNVLRMPGFLTKNRQPYSLVLTDDKGKPYPQFEFMVKMKQRPHGAPIFDMTNFRGEWRQACAKLKLGVFDPKTRTYRGAQPHDFRRTAATRMITERKASEASAMSVTGHKTNSMFKRYAIENPDLQRTALG